LGMRWWVAVLVVVAGAATLGWAETEITVAVMPFENVSAVKEADWLSLGVAESLYADLQAMGKFAMVERLQLERARNELKLASTWSRSR